MGSISEFILTPVGRFVQGSLSKPYDKDFYGKPREHPQYYIGLAINKQSPDWAPLWQKLSAKAANDFRNGEPSRPGFAWKIMDGDDPKHAGRDGWRGHIILRLTTGFPPKCYGNTNPVQAIDPATIKCGYYIRCNIGVRGNDDPQKPGMYLNLDMVQLCGFGAEIVTGPDAGEVFSAPAGALPPGASATPMAPVGGFPQPQPQGFPQPGAGAPFAAPAVPQWPTGAPSMPPATSGFAAPAQGAPAGFPSSPGTPAAPGIAAPATTYPSNTVPDWGFLNPQQQR